METAVVTLTCPHCGGQVHGVEATNVDQTVACTYCGTELHIPRIGTEVVHERVVVVEPSAQPAPAPAPAAPDLSLYPDPYDPLPQDLRIRSRSPVWIAVLIALAAVAIGAGYRCNEAAELRSAQQNAAEARCRAQCKDACYARSDDTAAPDASSDEVDEIDMEVQRMEHANDAELCAMSCDTKCTDVPAPP